MFRSIESGADALRNDVIEIRCLGFICGRHFSWTILFLIIRHFRRFYLHEYGKWSNEEERNNRWNCCSSSFRLLPMLFDLFVIIFHCKVPTMKSFNLRSINSRNGQVRENNDFSKQLNCIRFFLGLGTTQEIDRLHVNPYDGTIVHYHDPISQFPEKIDQLLIALNKVSVIFHSLCLMISP